MISESPGHFYIRVAEYRVQLCQKIWRTTLVQVWSMANYPNPPTICAEELRRAHLAVNQNDPESRYNPFLSLCFGPFEPKIWTQNWTPTIPNQNPSDWLSAPACHSFGRDARRPPSGGTPPSVLLRARPAGAGCKGPSRMALDPTNLRNPCSYCHRRKTIKNHCSKWLWWGQPSGCWWGRCAQTWRVAGSFYERVHTCAISGIYTIFFPPKQLFLVATGRSPKK